MYHSLKINIPIKAMFTAAADNIQLSFFSKDDVQSDKMRDSALKKAAEIAQEKGFRYFTVQSEGEIVIVQATPRDKNILFPTTNLYYELIQERNFGRDRIVPSEPAEEGVFSGYRVIFNGTNENSAPNTMDVCDHIPCKK